MTDRPVLCVPAREIPIPSTLSAEAQAALAAILARSGTALPDFPAQDDKAAWHIRAATQNAALLTMLQAMRPQGGVTTVEKTHDGVRYFDIVPDNAEPGDRTIVIDMHGGGLFLCGGELCRIMAEAIALRLGRRVWSVDYRMPPDHPYPAALDDALVVYRALLEERAPHEILAYGASAGGNLIAALVLRARDEGLPMPAALCLNTPEIDLTESGDSFETNRGVDAALSSLMPANLLYANGHDLRHPYLSPLFGDFTRGFPPTVLVTGTRDLFLSNTVLMHRALRRADVPAELHVYEAGGHGGFATAPEGREIDRDLRSFLTRALAAAR